MTRRATGPRHVNKRDTFVKVNWHLAHCYANFHGFPDSPRPCVAWHFHRMIDAPISVADEYDFVHRLC